MNELEKLANEILNQDCPVRKLSQLISETKVSEINASEFRKIVDLLEIHEEEIRQLRQTARLKMREYFLNTYSAKLRNKLAKE